MKYLTVIVEDRVGLIADISYILSKAKINIETISVEVVGDKAIITLGINDIKRAQDVLKNSGYHSVEKDAIILKLEDKPGELNKIANLLKDHKITIKNVHMLSRDGKHTALAMIVDKPKSAKKILEEYLVQ